MLQCGERTRIKLLGEGIVHQKRGHQQQLRVVEILEPVALQGAEIVRIAELRAQLFENRPVAITLGTAELTFEMLAEILLHGIVIEQGIVHIEQKYDIPTLREGPTLRHGTSPDCNKRATAYREEVRQRCAEIVQVGGNVQSASAADKAGIPALPWVEQGLGDAQPDGPARLDIGDDGDDLLIRKEFTKRRHVGGAPGSAEGNRPSRVIANRSSSECVQVWPV